jgi:hypothetical protein
MRASLSVIASVGVLLTWGGATGFREPVASFEPAKQSRMDPPLSDCQYLHYQRCLAHGLGHIHCYAEAQEQLCVK